MVRQNPTSKINYSSTLMVVAIQLDLPEQKHCWLSLALFHSEELAPGQKSELSLPEMVALSLPGIMGLHQVWITAITGPGELINRLVNQLGLSHLNG